MYKEDESHWFLLQFATASRNYKDLSEMLYLYYENPETGQNLREELAWKDCPIQRLHVWVLVSAQKYIFQPKHLELCQIS